MTHEVELSSQAEQDLREIYLYIQEHGPAHPEDWLEGLEKKLVSLKAFPEGCSIAPENDFVEKVIRQTLFGVFRILFTIRAQKVYVITVRHSARKFMTKDELKGI